MINSKISLLYPNLRSLKCYVMTQRITYEIGPENIPVDGNKTLGCMHPKCNESKNIGILPISSCNENKFTARHLRSPLRNLGTFYDRDNGCLLVLVLAEGRGGEANNSFYASCHQPDQAPYSESIGSKLKSTCFLLYP